VVPTTTASFSAVRAKYPGVPEILLNIPYIESKMLLFSRVADTIWLLTMRVNTFFLSPAAQNLDIGLTCRLNLSEASFIAFATDFTLVPFCLW
jgi:hypothetical protein